MESSESFERRTLTVLFILIVILLSVIVRHAPARRPAITRAAPAPATITTATRAPREPIRP